MYFIWSNISKMLPFHHIINETYHWANLHSFLVLSLWNCGVYFTFTGHLSSDQPHFKCSGGPPLKILLPFLWWGPGAKGSSVRCRHYPQMPEWGLNTSWFSVEPPLSPFLKNLVSSNHKQFSTPLVLFFKRKFQEIEANEESLEPKWNEKSKIGRCIFNGPWMSYSKTAQKLDLGSKVPLK